MQNRNRNLVWYTVMAAVLAAGLIFSWPLAEAFAQATTGDTSSNTDGAALNFFSLLLGGGYLMLPILVMSLLVVTFAIERFIGLRRERVLPQDLITGLGELGGPQSSFDPRQAYRLCQQHTSAASSVVRAMLLKVGRPHSEVERAVIH